MWDVSPLSDEAKLATVQQILAALATGDLPVLQRTLSPEVRLDAEGRHKFSGTFSGAGEVLAYAATSSRNFDVATTSLDQATVDGEAVTLLLGVDLLITKGKWRTRLIQTYRFGDDGLVHHIRVRAEDPEEFERMAEQTRIR